MPPKLPAAAAVPPDEEEVKAQDMLILQDLMDTLEQMPTEMTRVHADLNELGAVLYCMLRARHCSDLLSIRTISAVKSKEEVA